MNEDHKSPEQRIAKLEEEIRWLHAHYDRPQVIAWAIDMHDHGLQHEAESVKRYEQGKEVALVRFRNGKYGFAAIKRY